MKSPSSSGPMVVLLLLPSILALIVVVVDAFTVVQQSTRTSEYCRSFGQLKSSENDDDWYADFNPAAFNYNDNANSNANSYAGGRKPYGQQQQGGGRQSFDRRRGGGGQRSSGPVRYDRDTSMDNSNVNLEVVESLIQDRVQARKSNDYDLADSIRDDLLQNHGVQVWDKDRVWRSGCSAGGSGGPRGDRRPRDNNAFGARQPPRGRKPLPDFGPLGHDYEMASDAGPIVASISEEEINQQIAARLQAKLSRRFDDADRIQQELTSAGVYVHDGRKEWRADGEFFGEDTRNNGRPGRERGSRNDRAMYSKSTYSDPSAELSEDDVSNIHSLISRRSKAKASRDYDVADTIREELKTNYNVFVDDKLMEWSVNGKFGQERDSDRFRPWAASQFSSSSAAVDTETILNLLEQRNTAKAERDFDAADQIRDTLLNGYNIAINDRLREWSVGGDFGLPMTNNKAAKENDRERPFVRLGGGGGTLTDDDIGAIADLVKERADAKKNRDFDAADSIRDRLEQEYSVKVDDKNRGWYVVTDEYALARSSRNVDEETIKFIQKRLLERAELKMARNFDAADDIRDELRDTFSVAIDDRNREFSITVEEVSVMGAKNNDYNNVRTFRQRSTTTELGYAIDDIEEPSTTTIADNESDDDVSTTTIDGSDVDWNGLTVVQLKERLREAGLPVSGNKSELISRLSDIV